MDDRLSWNAAAVPWNEPTTVSGMPRSSLAFSISWVASPSEVPGVTLNEMVAAGSWLWWLITEARTLVVSTLISIDRGTGFPLRGELM